MPFPQRLCIFDLDGTLADTAPDLVAALNAVLREEGLRLADFDEARAFVGHGARVLLERAHEAQGIDLGDAQATLLTERFVAHYANAIADNTVLFDHALEAMDVLAETGWRFAVCTNKREALARQLLQALAIEQRFDAICGGDTFDVRKPDGRHILRTIEIAGGSASHALMVGDSSPDVLAAKDARVPVIAVSFGYANVAAGELGADALIDSFADLPQLAERLVPRASAA